MVKVLMKQALTLSIVIPVYNEQDHLGACLQSIAAQTVLPNEVLVVDNNSTDDTVAIARQFPFVKVLHEETQGVLFARNKGFDAATGAVIGRLDADSRIAPDWVARVLEDFVDEQVAAVTGPVRFYDMPGGPGNYKVDNFIRRSILLHNRDFPLLFGTNMAIRRSVWEEVMGGLCTRRDIHEDLDLAVHLFQSQPRQRIYYDEWLVGGMSARRYDDSWAAFRNYCAYMKRTYEVHGIHSKAPALALNINKLGYFILWPLRRSYDDTTGRRSLKRLFTGGNIARKHPMT
jgi:glycosyltransferase involved in cell wall biosynthesis